MSRQGYLKGTDQGWGVSILEYREFGKTGVKVSTIGMGTYYDPPYIIMSRVFGYQRDRERKLAALRKGLELGITLIDTAEIYQTEDIVADAIEGHDRDSLFIMTKVFRNHLRYNAVLKAAENSLKRLRCRYVDLYQIHFPHSRIPIDETMEAMKKLVDDGKVRFVGVSNFSLDELRRAEDALGRIPLTSNQVEYNLQAREIERDLVPYCEEQDIVILPYRPVAHGALARPSGELQTVMDELSLKHGGKTPAQIALNWLQAKSKIVFPIPRASKPERVVENVGAVGWRLDVEDRRKLENAVGTS